MNCRRLACSKPNSALAVALLIVAVVFAATPAFATIIITERESRSSLFVFAGSGPGVDQYGANDVSNALTGTFSFSDDYSASVANQTGAAAASGEVAATDGVTQANPDSLFLSVGHTAEGAATWISGTGLTASNQSQLLRVRFQLTEPTHWSLTGFFDPGQDNGLSRLRLYNVAFGFDQFDLDDTAIVNLSGTITPGSSFNTYEFIARISNELTTNGAATPIDSDASGMNLQFTLSTVPEPSLLALALLGAGVGFARHRRPAE